MISVQTVLAIFLVQAIFFTGVWYAANRAATAQTRLDLKNIGDKVRQSELKLLYVAMMICPEEKRQEVLNALVRRLT